MKPKAIFNWSGGKDSALCLHTLLQSQEFDITCLLTSISEFYQRISMHGVRVELLEQQAVQIGLPLVKLSIPEMPTMETYEKVMRKTLVSLKEQGAEVSVFGDIFLADLRTYREIKLAELNLNGVFPLWGRNTRELIETFIQLGFKTIITCVNEKYLDQSFAGRIIDESFLRDLPPNVDPCGENGEFHTFVFDGPIFKAPIFFTKGEVVYRKYEQPTTSKNNDCPPDTAENNPYQYGFWYCDLLPT
jgi:uncharacterized protein (TIGR00290 family)